MIISYRTVNKTRTEIFIGRFDEISDIAAKRLQLKKRNAFLFFDSGLPESHRSTIEESLSEHFSKIYTNILPAGEDAKNLATVSRIARELIIEGITRKDIIIVAGGGASLDAGNFLAGILKRGVDSILIPTTLLSMVDASIGGKNAVNIDSIKNQLGTFHNPRAILIDTEFLSTLPERELKSGFGEVIKTLFLDGSENILSGMNKIQVNKKVIEACVRFKAKIVKNDPFETKGKREILNFGHTIGHGLEAASAESITHGEAVAVSLYAEQRIGEMLNKEKPAISEKILEVLKKFDYGFSVFSSYDPLPYLRYDKKTTHVDKVRFVYLKAEAKPYIINVQFDEFADAYLRVKDEISSL